MYSSRWNGNVSRQLCASKNSKIDTKGGKIVFVYFTIFDIPVDRRTNCFSVPFRWKQHNWKTETELFTIDRARNHPINHRGSFRSGRKSEILTRISNICIHIRICICICTWFLKRIWFYCNNGMSGFRTRSCTLQSRFGPRECNLCCNSLLFPFICVRIVILAQCVWHVYDLNSFEIKIYLWKFDVLCTMINILMHTKMRVFVYKFCRW